MFEAFCAQGSVNISAQTSKSAHLVVLDMLTVFILTRVTIIQCVREILTGR